MPYKSGLEALPPVDDTVRFIASTYWKARVRSGTTRVIMTAGCVTSSRNRSNPARLFYSLFLVLHVLRVVPCLTECLSRARHVAYCPSRPTATKVILYADPGSTAAITSNLNVKRNVLRFLSRGKALIAELECRMMVGNSSGAPQGRD